MTSSVWIGAFRANVAMKRRVQSEGTVLLCITAVTADVAVTAAPGNPEPPQTGPPALSAVASRPSGRAGAPGVAQRIDQEAGGHGQDHRPHRDLGHRMVGGRRHGYFPGRQAW